MLSFFRTKNVAVLVQHLLVYLLVEYLMHVFLGHLSECVHG